MSGLVPLDIYRKVTIGVAGTAMVWPAEMVRMPPSVSGSGESIVRSAPTRTSAAPVDEGCRGDACAIAAQGWASASNPG